MHDDRALVEKRITRFLTTRLEPARLRSAAPAEIDRWDVVGEPVPIAEGLAADYRPAALGEPWGAPWTTSWLRISAVVPAEWEPGSVELEVDLGFDSGRPGFQAEGLAIAPDGTLIKGINPLNRFLPLAPGPDGRILVFVEAAANPDNERLDFAPITTGDRETAPRTPLYSLRSIRLVERDRDVEALFHDVEVLDQLMHELPPESTRRHGILRVLERTIDLIGSDAIADRAQEARRLLADALGRPAVPSALAGR